MDIRAELSIQTTLAIRAKRALDVVGAITGLLLFALLYIPLALAIWMDSPGPVIYRQLRLGRAGHSFYLFKLRSMIDECSESAEDYLTRHPEERAAYQEYQKLADHPCYTRVGRWLSRTSLDEMPQFWNVLRGEMSLVGPRPILPEQQILYGAKFSDYIHMRPGMTGLWQVSGRNRLPFTERPRLDAEYIHHWSLWLDTSILVKTIWVVLTQHGVV